MWGQLRSHLYYETILGPDHTGVTWWFIWPLHSLSMSWHIPRQPALSQLLSRCLILGPPPGAELQSGRPHPSFSSSSFVCSFRRLRSLSAAQLTVNLLLEYVSVRRRAWSLVRQLVILGCPIEGEEKGMKIHIIETSSSHLFTTYFLYQLPIKTIKNWEIKISLVTNSSYSFCHAGNLKWSGVGATHFCCKSQQLRQHRWHSNRCSSSLSGLVDQD